MRRVDVFWFLAIFCDYSLLTDACSVIALDDDTSSQTIDSPYTFRGSIDACWLIRSESTSQPRLDIRANTFYCSGAEVTVYDGSSTDACKFGDYCNSFDSKTSSTSEMYVRVKADSWFDVVNFQLEVVITSDVASGCSEPQFTSGEIAGIVIGALIGSVLLFCLCVGFCCCLCEKKKPNQPSTQESNSGRVHPESSATQPSVSSAGGMYAPQRGVYNHDNAGYAQNAIYGNYGPHMSGLQDGGNPYHLPPPPVYVPPSPMGTQGGYMNHPQPGPFPPYGPASSDAPPPSYDAALAYSKIN